MAKAIWNDTVVAQSDRTVEVEGYPYFPRASVRLELLRPTGTTSTCPWKGSAKYFSIVIDGKENSDAAWTDENPKPVAEQIKGYIGFWRGVQIQK
jgi:uncharacterized protein (DUF427 family)